MAIQGSLEGLDAMRTQCGGQQGMPSGFAERKHQPWRNDGNNGSISYIMYCILYGLEVLLGMAGFGI